MKIIMSGDYYLLLLVDAGLDGGRVLEVEYLRVVLLLHVVDKVQLGSDQVQVINEAGRRGHSHRGRSLQSKVILN